MPNNETSHGAMSLTIGIIIAVELIACMVANGADSQPASMAARFTGALEMIYGNSTGSNTAEGMHQLETLAKEGSSQAAYELGAYYANGQCVSRDFAKAQGYLRQSAEMGSLAASSQLQQLSVYLATHPGPTTIPATKPAGLPNDAKAVHGEDLAAFKESLYRDADLPSPTVVARLAEWVKTHPKDADSRVHLALAYHSGRPNCAAHVREIPQLLNDAIKQGSSDAQAVLGFLKVAGQAVPADAPGGLALIREAMRTGNPIAYKAMGDITAQGLGGVASDIDEAAKLYVQAAAKGMPSASDTLAKTLARSNPNSNSAHDAVIESAKGGDLEAKFFLADYYRSRGQSELAFRDMQSLAKNGGLAIAQDVLGQYYLHAVGVHADPWEAARWFREASDAGFEPAKFHLAMAYLNGTGAIQDLPTGAAMLKAMDKDGYGDASCILGLMYIQGRGVERNPEKGRACIARARKEGIRETARALKELLGQG